MIEDFFAKLGGRLRNENHLSDITWALAEVSPFFKRSFLQFFFQEIDNDANISLFKREYSVGDCRPDFYSIINGREYIIECKIWDRNDHFVQYKNQFTNAKFGHITNYPMHSVVEGYDIREWSHLEAFLETQVHLLEEGLEKSLIFGYLTYLRTACGIFKPRKMDLRNLNSLYNFNKMLERLICSLDGYETSIYKQGKSFESWKSGYSFTVKKRDSITIYPWLGVYYGGEVQIYLEINSFDKQVYDSIDVESAHDGNFFEAPEFDANYGSYKWFYLKQSLFDRFNHPECNVQEQQSIIRSFVLEVLDFLDLEKFKNSSVAIESNPT